jgi:hypothetical protein
MGYIAIGNLCALAQAMSYDTRFRVVENGV